MDKIINFKDSFMESLKDHLGKFSSTRISGYYMSFLLTLCVLTSVGLEITSAVTSYKENTPYSVSVQIITIIGMVLGQQALLFNLKRKSEDTPFPTLEHLEDNKIKETIPTTDIVSESEEEKITQINS